MNLPGNLFESFSATRAELVIGDCLWDLRDSSLTLSGGRLLLSGMVADGLEIRELDISARKLLPILEGKLSTEALRQGQAVIHKLHLSVSDTWATRVLSRTVDLAAAGITHLMLKFDNGWIELSGRYKGFVPFAVRLGLDLRDLRMAFWVEEILLLAFIPSGGFIKKILRDLLKKQLRFPFITSEGDRFWLDLSRLCPVPLRPGEGDVFIEGGRIKIRLWQRPAHTTRRLVWSCAWDPATLAFFQN
ncbi:MAG: hypothetical protein HYU64_16895 [Armatimonadetes bacterium]|nr:hypothetical protein [Armatimonadota bacterium]